MKTIHQLPQHIIAKIAAGEVIERPAYAVKELLENAIDAKADYITIQIEEAGLKKIVVTDNGIGMSREDLIESSKPHTTSKLFHQEQLTSIQTLGFRGEALSSIAAISNMTLRSRTINETAGVEIKMKDGKIEKISPVGLPIGTSIIVEQLFHTVPVRKKFLKSQLTEFRYILEIITSYALAFPHIRFFLTHNKKNVLDVPKNQNSTDRIKMLLGKDVFHYLIPISVENTYVGIKGFLSKPQVSTTSTSKQFIFVNNRRVQDKLIATTIKESYGNLLEPVVSPIFILFLTVPFEIVDVNVHPRKEQVNFINKQILFENLQQVITQTLSENNITFHTTRWKNDPLYDEQRQTLYSPKKGLTHSFAGNILKDSVDPWTMQTKITHIDSVIQINSLYLLIQTEHTIVLIDQHAAHERILFEQFVREFKKQKKDISMFQLPTPQTFALSISDAQMIKEKEDFFQQLGFTIELFQENTLVVSTVPLLLKDRNITTYIMELLDDISEEKGSKEIDRQSTKMITYLACRSAIKAGEKLTKLQMKELIKKLEVTKNNATCPHGRPTKVIIPLQAINTLFKRR